MAITARKVRGNTFCIYNKEIRLRPSSGDTQSGFVVAGARARSDGLCVPCAVYKCFPEDEAQTIKHPLHGGCLKNTTVSA